MSGTQVTEPGPGEVQVPGAAAPGWSTLWAALADAGCVLLFVVIGRANHDKGETLAGVASTAWPFLAGLALGWFAARAWRRPRAVVPAGLLAWIGTVAFGNLLRVWGGQGTAFAFILVALAFLGLFLLGWRLVARLLIEHLRRKATS